MPHFREYFTDGSFEILDHFPAAIVITDMNKKIIHANSNFRKFFTIAEQDLKNKTCWEVIHPDQPECIECSSIHCSHLQSTIGGQKYNFIVSGKKFGEEVILRIIQDITAIAFELGALTHLSENNQNKL